MLSYPGNLGVAEVAQVYMFGSDEQIEKLEEIINEDPFDEDKFIDFIEDVTGTRLHPLLVKPAIESPVKLNLDYPGITGTSIYLESKMKRTGAIFNHRNRGAKIVGRSDPDPKAMIGLQGKHSLQEFADKDNVLTLDDKNTKDYRLVVGNIGDFETAAVTKEYRRVGLHPNVVRDYDKDGKLIYEVAASFWGDRAGAIVRARKLATSLGSSVQVVVGGVATEVQPDEAAICEVCGKRLVKTKLGKTAVMACPEFLNGDLKHTSFDVKRAVNIGDFAQPVEDPNWVGKVVGFDDLTGTYELHGVDFYAIQIGGQEPEEAIDSSDKRWFTANDLTVVAKIARKQTKEGACISVTTWGDDEDIMIWTKNEGPGGEMMFGKKRADWDKIDIQTKDGFVEVYLGEGGKLLTTSDNAVISPTDLVTPDEYAVVVEELKNGVAEKEAASSLLDDVEDTIINYDIDTSDQSAATDKVFEQLQSTWSGLTRDEVADAVKMWVERQGKKRALQVGLLEAYEAAKTLIIDEWAFDKAITFVTDKWGLNVIEVQELTKELSEDSDLNLSIDIVGVKQSMTFTYGPEESAQDDNVEYHVNLQGYYLPSGNPPTDLNQLLSPDILARIDFTEMKENTYESGGYWSGWDWWNGASEAGRAELLRNLEGTPLAMLATGAEFLAQLEWMIIKTLIYRLAGGSAAEGDKLIEDYVKPATNPDEPYAGTDVQLYIRLRGTMALGALVDALDETAGWNWADIRDSFGYIGDWWAGEDYGYYDCVTGVPMYASLKPLLEKVCWAANDNGDDEVRRKGEPKTDEERLQTHFGDDWENHDVSELPERGTGLDDEKESQQQQVKDVTTTHLNRRKRAMTKADIELGIANAPFTLEPLLIDEADDKVMIEIYEADEANMRTVLDDYGAQYEVFPADEPDVLEIYVTASKRPFGSRSARRRLAMSKEAGWDQSGMKLLEVGDHVEFYHDFYPSGEFMVTEFLSDDSGIKDPYTDKEAVMTVTPVDGGEAIPIEGSHVLNYIPPKTSQLKGAPASWVEDEDIWEKAKEAVGPDDGSYDDYYAVVTDVYKEMGGGIKS